MPYPINPKPGRNYHFEEQFKLRTWLHGPREVHEVADWAAVRNFLSRGYPVFYDDKVIYEYRIDDGPEDEVAYYARDRYMRACILHEDGGVVYPPENPPSAGG